MADSTLLALLTVVSMLCAISMAAFAWKMNEDWANHCDKMNEDWANHCDKMNEDWANRCDKMNEDWAEFYKTLMGDKHDC